MSLLQALFAFEPWTASSINARTMAAWDSWPHNPAVLVGAAVALASAGYLLLARWRGRRASIRMIGAVFLAGWLCLDVPWQWQLFRQLEATREEFAHLPASDRLGVTAYAAPLEALASAVQRLTDDPRRQRVFVASAVEYSGIRLAYQLYPMNVYWSRKRELPQARHFRSGDLVVLVPPTRVAIHRTHRALRLESGEVLPVDRVLDQWPGLVYRVL